MVSCKDCWHSRYFEYCGAEGCVCMLTSHVMDKEKADGDGVCQGYEPMDSNDPEK